MCFSPVSASASTSWIFRAVVIGPGSIWKPSRGPSSWISMLLGISDMADPPGASLLDRRGFGKIRRALLAVRGQALAQLGAGEAQELERQRGIEARTGQPEP